MLRFPTARAACLLACTFLAIAVSAGAQTPSAQNEAATAPKARPKVGLVLSGGGARGAAHVGVLKVLEELRVPVDVIVGTSMGSIVGGSYASGMSVPEMEDAIKLITTDTLFTDRPPRSDLPMRRKADDANAYIIPELGISKEGISLPKGIVTGVSVEAQLRRLVKTGAESNFDRLPIPFRAVATDLGTGEMVVLKEGSLVTAMRASMSVPGGMAPVQIGHRQLVDGGLVRNLPVDLARQLGADVVIAVNLGTPLLKPEEIKSVLSVTAQMINILTEQNVRQSLSELKPQDILILPELGDFSAGNFNDLPKTVPIGEAAARKVADRLRALSLPPAQYAALRKRQSAESSASVGEKVDEIVVVGTKRVNREVVLQSMDTAVGQPFSQDTLDLDLRRIYGRGDFENVGYVIDDIDGKRVLTVRVTEKPEEQYVRFGLTFEADVGTSAEFQVLASHRWKWLNSFGAEWRNDVSLGRNVLLATEFYQPLSPRQYFFVAPRLAYTLQPFDVFVDDLLVAEYRDQEATVRLDLGANFSHYGEARLGLTVGERKFTQQSGSLLLPATGSGPIRQVNFDLKFDQLEGLNFPTGGWGLGGSVDSTLQQLGADSTYTRWILGGKTAFTGGRHTLELMAEAGGKLGSGAIPSYDQFPLGGFLHLSGLQKNQLRADQYQFARINYRTKVGNIPLFEGMFFGASLEAARLNPLIPVWRGERVNGTLTVPAAALYLGIDSPIGPLYVGYGYSNAQSRAIYIFLGRP